MIILYHKCDPLSIKSANFFRLNNGYLIDFYNSSELELWNKYLLLAVDINKAEVPNSQENRNSFVKSNNQHSEKRHIRTLASCTYDILNGFYLNTKVAHISTSKNELAK